MTQTTTNPQDRLRLWSDRSGHAFERWGVSRTVAGVVLVAAGVIILVAPEAVFIVLAIAFIVIGLLLLLTPTMNPGHPAPMTPPAERYPARPVDPPHRDDEPTSTQALEPPTSRPPVNPPPPGPV